MRRFQRVRSGQYVTTTITELAARLEGVRVSKGNREPDPGRNATVALRATSALRVMLYGTAFEQDTDTAGAASFVAAPVPTAVEVMAARQEAWTVAETLIEALADAAAAGLMAEPDARMLNARIGNVAFKVTALPPARTNT